MCDRYQYNKYSSSRQDNNYFQSDYNPENYNNKYSSSRQDTNYFQSDYYPENYQTYDYYQQYKYDCNSNRGYKRPLSTRNDDFVPKRQRLTEPQKQSSSNKRNKRANARRRENERTKATGSAKENKPTKVSNSTADTNDPIKPLIPGEYEKGFWNNLPTSTPFKLVKKSDEGRSKRVSRSSTLKNVEQSIENSRQDERKSRTSISESKTKSRTETKSNEKKKSDEERSKRVSRRFSVKNIEQSMKNRRQDERKSRTSISDNKTKSRSETKSKEKKSGESSKNLTKNVPISNKSIAKSPKKSPTNQSKTKSNTKQSGESSKDQAKYEAVLNKNSVENAELPETLDDNANNIDVSLQEDLIEIQQEPVLQQPQDPTQFVTVDTEYLKENFDIDPTPANKLTLIENWLNNPDDGKPDLNSTAKSNDSVLVNMDDTVRSDLIYDMKGLYWVHTQQDIPLAKVDDSSKKPVEVKPKKSPDICVATDTNIFIRHLNLIEDIMRMKGTATRNVFVYIPWMVMQELEEISLRKNDPVLKRASIKYMQFLKKYLNVEGSSLRDQDVMKAAVQKHLGGKCPDNKVLACCFQAQDEYDCVILFTDDINLGNKGKVNDIPVGTSRDVMKKIKEQLASLPA